MYNSTFNSVTWEDGISFTNTLPAHWGFDPSYGATVVTVGYNATGGRGQTDDYLKSIGKLHFKQMIRSTTPVYSPIRMKVKITSQIAAETSVQVSAAKAYAKGLVKPYNTGAQHSGGTVFLDDWVPPVSGYPYVDYHVLTLDPGQFTWNSGVSMWDNEIAVTSAVLGVDCRAVASGNGAISATANAGASWKFEILDFGGVGYYFQGGAATHLKQLHVGITDSNNVFQGSWIADCDNGEYTLPMDYFGADTYTLMFYAPGALRKD